ncbi:unnamed protein product, partial [Scytosiphon promiscuus]
MNTRAYFAWVFAARWLGFRMNIINRRAFCRTLSFLCFLLTTLMFVGLNGFRFEDAGLLGAALVYVLQLSDLFQWAVRQ